MDNSISPTSSANSLSMCSLNPDARSLSADSLLFYCRAQLKGLDGDIQSYMDQQRTNLAYKNAAGHVENVMKKYQPVATNEQRLEVHQAFSDAMTSLGWDSPEGQALQALRNEIMAWEVTGVYPTKDQWTGEIGKLTQLREKVGDTSELNMIQLQSMVSQRQTVVELTTNMLNKLTQTDKSVVDNVR